MIGQKLTSFRKLASVRTAVATIAFVLLLASGALAQVMCDGRDQYHPAGVPYPLWNWHLFNKGTLPQSVFYHVNEDILQFTIQDGSSLNLSDNQMVVRLGLTPQSNWGWKTDLGMGLLWRQEGNDFDEPILGSGSFVIADEKHHSEHHRVV